jgi:hypothetical protein
MALPLLHGLEQELDFPGTCARPDALADGFCFGSLIRWRVLVHAPTMTDESLRINQNRTGHVR